MRNQKGIKEQQEAPRPFEKLSRKGGRSGIFLLQRGKPAPDVGSLIRRRPLLSYSIERALNWTGTGK